MNVYENCPQVENESFCLRLVSEGDLDDLLKVYSDPDVVPLFGYDGTAYGDYWVCTL